MTPHRICWFSPNLTAHWELLKGSERVSFICLVWERTCVTNARLKKKNVTSIQKPAFCTAHLSPGVFVWAGFEHFLTTGVPSTRQHPAKFRFLHCTFLYMVTLGNILEKLRICSMPRFIQFLHNRVRIKKDPGLVVTNLRFGTIPMRLFQPEVAAPSPRRGIIFFHGGGTILGSLDMYRTLCGFLSQETDSVLLSVG
ncbi:arylacetamide deacetylase-like 4 [Globicephala melas]|uniref:arylacetamide deacetylase-like 4 n=1 Tax=Globicephala melas TaxID=9731 RepID=UPI003873100C